MPDKNLDLACHGCGCELVQMPVNCFKYAGGCVWCLDCCERGPEHVKGLEALDACIGVLAGKFAAAMKEPK